VDVDVVLELVVEVVVDVLVVVVEVVEVLVVVDVVEVEVVVLVDVLELVVVEELVVVLVVLLVEVVVPGAGAIPKAVPKNTCEDDNVTPTLRPLSGDASCSHSAYTVGVLEYVSPVNPDPEATVGLD
jgi:hypothetical protein